MVKQNKTKQNLKCANRRQFALPSFFSTFDPHNLHFCMVAVVIKNKTKKKKTLII